MITIQNSRQQQEEQQWANLPKELAEAIAKFFDSRIDIIRFRSVCPSWRYSISSPSFDQEIPTLSFQLPFQIKTANFYKSSIFKMVFLNNQESKRPSSSSSSKSKSWLVKIQESKYGKLELFNPLNGQKIRYSPFDLNLLDVNLVKLCDAFVLKNSSGYSTFGVNKVVLFNKEESSILAIYHEGKLGYFKYGDEEWTLLDDTNFQYDDIIEYKHQFYVVDGSGTVFWIDKSLRIIQYSPPLYGCDGQKHLVESRGDLYIVDRYPIDERRCWWRQFENIEKLDIFECRKRAWKCYPKATDFRVYKLDEEWGTWVNVKCLDDRVFVLGTDYSLSISSVDFVGGKGNCIYFIDDNDHTGAGLSADCIRVFQLEDRAIKKVSALPKFSEIFWPPNAGST